MSERRRFNKAAVREIYDELQEGIAQHERCARESDAATTRASAKSRKQPHASAKRTRSSRVSSSRNSPRRRPETTRRGLLKRDRLLRPRASPPHILTPGGRP